MGASASYIANDYWEDSLVLGLVNVLNAFLPLVLWSQIISPTYEKMNSNKVFLYSWYGMQGGHILAYGIPALVWPFIYSKNASFIRALFAYTWTYGSQILGPVACAYTISSLMLASYDYNKIGDRDEQGNILLHLTDIWAT